MEIRWQKVMMRQASGNKLLRWGEIESIAKSNDEIGGGGDFKKQATEEIAEEAKIKNFLYNANEETNF